MPEHHNNTSEWCYVAPILQHYHLESVIYYNINQYIIPTLLITQAPSLSMYLCPLHFPNKPAL